jgi:hypothetical protein
MVTLFIMIFLYNALTPHLSDDLAYRLEVSYSNSLWGLIVQQYQEYLLHNGRFITQLFIRLFLSADKWLFNLLNSGMFILLVMLIYENILMSLSGKVAGHKHHPSLLLLIAGMLFRYSVQFGQTILWLSGACNYLWGMVIILGFITFYRKNLGMAKEPHGIVMAIICLFWGFVAGWCSENTSGGALVCIFIMTLFSVRTRRRTGEKAIRAFMVTSHVGLTGGMAGLLLSPGISMRASLMSDNYTGLWAYLSRLYKCTLTIERLFFELLCLLLVLVVLALVVKKDMTVIKNNISFFFAAVAATGALIMIPPPTDRAYFGIGIFLILICLQSFARIFYDNNEKADHAVSIDEGDKKTSELGRYYLVGRIVVISIMTLWLFFTYTENLVNLARIYREENERIALLEDAAAAGKTTVIVPMHRPEFANRYSTAHDNDLSDDPEYWINTFYRDYYHVSKIIALPWEEYNLIND